jgi:hypothetical protein
MAMAKIQLPLLPLYLFRYRAIGPSHEVLQREIAAIKEPYLWCGDFTSLNDPMEGFYRPTSLLKNKDNYARIARTILNSKSDIGIASFSDTGENELMWTHYARNYSGICIKYYSQRLLDALPSRVSLVHMAYGDSPPRVTSKDIGNDDSGARKILSQKKFNWAYEREWRVLGSVGKLPINSDDVVRSIYLGSRIEEIQKKAILKTFRGSEIDIYEMDVSGYEHKWNRVHHAVSRRKPRTVS